MEENLLEIVQTLKCENEQLKQHLIENLKRSAAKLIIDKYQLSAESGEYLAYLDLAVLRTDAELTDTIETLAERIEASMLAACRNNGVEPPTTSTGFLQSYLQKMRAKEADDTAYRESLSFAE